MSQTTELGSDAVSSEVQSETTQPLISDQHQGENKSAVGHHDFELKLDQVPPYFSGQNMEDFVREQGLTTFRRIRKAPRWKYCFISFESEADMVDGLQKLKEMTVKGRQLKVSRAKQPKDKHTPQIPKASEKITKVKRDSPDNEQPDEGQGKEIRVEETGLDNDDDELIPTSETTKTVLEATAPNFGTPYERQLIQKRRVAIKSIQKIGRLLKQNKATPTPFWIDSHNKSPACPFEGLFPSPVTEKYRNKIKFTIGYDIGNNPCVGFCVGRRADRGLIIAKPDDCPLIPQLSIDLANGLTEWIKTSSPWKAYEMVSHTGFFRELMVRVSRKDELMVCCVVCSTNTTPEEMLDAKSQFLQFLHTFPHPYHSVMWGINNGFSTGVDCDVEYGLLEGQDSITETLLGKSFRISPNSFFQVNTLGAELLFTKVNDFLSLPISAIYDGLKFKADRKNNLRFEILYNTTTDDAYNGSVTAQDLENERGFVAASKIPKLWEERKEGDAEGAGEKEEEGEKEETDDEQRTLLDVCCGTGTIGICLRKKNDRLIGLELEPSAVQNAFENAALNAIPKELHMFYQGKAEDTIAKAISEFGLGNSPLAIVDPPRSGLHMSIIETLRKTTQITRLVYVSCNHDSFERDTIRLISARFQGKKCPNFVFVRAASVDMFPHTDHLEMIGLFVRESELTKEEERRQAIEQIEQRTEKSDIPE
ncbi:putative Zinc finger family protein [Blattamonas nauphoetae]|uniref:Zinc finger family protein n=1 Tax=Blattamonas nauphoetae TaxID=2049346 RepID=A0ABQ9YCP9_9EUKA|nr:putative Zinc finger family protein [Blattamonas nauphoetae]